MILRGEVPDHAADCGQQQDKADHAPNDGSAGWAIPNQFFMRPILRIADILTGTIGACSPSCPPEEGCHLVLFGGIGQGTGWNSVLIPSFAKYI